MKSNSLRMALLKKHRFLLLGLLTIALVGIPTSYVLFQQTTENRSRAEKTAVLTFAPPSSEATPMQVQNGDTFSLDMFINPGNNLVSSIKAEILYDQTKFEVGRGLPFQPNQAAFTQLVEGPTYSPGKVTFTLSVGTDLSRVIRQQTRFGTMTFRAIGTTSETPTLISYGPGTQVFSISANSTPTENVVASTIPATILVGNPPCVARPACIDTNPQCLLAEPSAGWCPAIPTPTPTSRVAPTPMACKNASIDTMMVMDKSGSMNDRIGSSRVTKMTGAKAAAKNFVDVLATDTQNRVGLTSFANTATINSTFTNNFSSVKSKIDALSANGYTCIQCAINKANQEVDTKGRPGVKKVVVLLTDGRANWVEGGSRKVSESQAEQQALQAALSGHENNGIVYYTVGLGNDVNANFLKNIADQTGGKYYFSPTADQLNQVYTEIAQVLAKGAISGFVFNDQNANGAYNSEPKLAGWELQMTTTGSSTSDTIDSDSDGSYSFDGLCEGTYTVKEVVKSGWKQTLPANNGSYTITIDNGNAVTERNFGNQSEATPTVTKAPTSTPTEEPTVIPTLTEVTREPSGTPTDIVLDLLLHGIGSAGDNANPESSMSNKSPAHTTRKTTLSIFDANNDLLTTATGNITYSSASGSYKGTVKAYNLPATGFYTIRVKTDNHLTRAYPGIQSLNGTSANTLPEVALVAGDNNTDNKLNIIDYNMLLDCYSDLVPPVSCSDAAKKVATDANDDGDVNQFDYNLFLREISTQLGQ